ncbi:H-NS family nucleoid-associated regulatory protein [Agitococcus lubricus]|uniref:Nucleoid protein H-NS n=1 Tax=Agitococcus lubricus TaxID=1077255 RepID=A0A2T5IUZ9_9GAMM|nr:H-NS histone family protein [Agitococcus lubricus]PTQ87715.1 nucleoid protein H-NS [Agitococcus lubricus]
MTIDLSSLSVEELNAVIVEAQQLIKAKRKSSIKQARAKVEQMAAELGITVEELMAVKTEVAAVKKVEPRYRNPANADETWTGRGKQPRWLATELAAGKSLDQFLI